MDMKKFMRPSFYFLLFTLCFMYVTRGLLGNLSNALLDRLDYPYIVWVVNNNVQNLLSGNFAHYFDTRGFYPHPYGLLFSDILLPQSLLVTPVYLLTRNIILSFNLIYVLTYFLDFTAAYLLWKHFFKSSYVAGIGALLIVFGPFYHMQMAHFQMQSYWIGLFGMVALLRCMEKPRMKLAVVGGLLLGIQFTASVYTFVFFSAWAAIICLITWLYAQKRLEIAQHAAAFFTVAGLVAAPFIKAYFTMKHYYSMERDIAEIILYAAHMTDYLFTNVYGSLLYHMPFWARWNQFDKHVIGEKAVFPGFFLVLFALIGIFSWMRTKKDWSISLPLDKYTVIFGLTAVVGFIGSLGPRLSFNGTYAHIPTPYLIGLKVLPMLDGIRSPTRWGFLLIIALIFFALRGVEKVRPLIAPSLRTGAAAFLIIWILFEYLPQPLSIYRVPPLARDYVTLEKLCAQKPHTLLVEYPVTHFNAFGGIVEGLGYISNVQLSQVSHNCLLMNGYSGFIPQQVFDTEIALNGFVAAGDIESLHTYMKAHDIAVIRFSPAFILKEYRAGYTALAKLLHEDPRFEKLGEAMYRLH